MKVSHWAEGFCIKDLNIFLCCLCADRSSYEKKKEKKKKKKKNETTGIYRNYGVRSLPLFARLSYSSRLPTAPNFHSVFLGFRRAFPGTLTRFSWLSQEQLLKVQPCPRDENFCLNSVDHLQSFLLQCFLNREAVLNLSRDFKKQNRKKNLTFSV